MEEITKNFQNGLDKANIRYEAYEAGRKAERQELLGTMRKGQENLIKIEDIKKEGAEAEWQRVRKAIGMLRQWLNEERIRDGKKFVTNEELAHWLAIGDSDE